MATDSGIEKRWSLFEESPTLVQQRFDDMRQYGLSGYNTAMESINALKVIAQSLELINRVIAIDTTPITTSEVTGTPPTIDIDQFKVDMPQLPGDPNIVDASVETLPTFPDVVTNKNVNQPNENYYSYSRTLLDAIKSRLLNEVNAGSDGLTPAVENAIFNRELERDILLEKDLEDGIASEWSSRGWPLPTGALVAAINQAKINFTNKRLDVSRDISIKSFDLALRNYHFIIEKGLGFEGHLLSWAHEVATLAYRASKELVDLDIDTFRALTGRDDAKTRSILGKAHAEIEYNKGLIDYKGHQLNAYSAYIRGQSERVNAVARGYEAETAVFKASTDFDIAKKNLDIKVIDTRMNQGIANANLMIKDKEIEMKNYELLRSLAVEAEKAIGQIAAQVAAGALASIHASVGISASDSAGYSYSGSDVELQPSKNETAIEVAQIQAGGE